MCARSSDLDQLGNRSKLVHNWLNLGSQRAKFGSGGAISETERRCPYCQLAEDFVHLLTCAAPRALKFRYDAMIPLRNTLADSGDGGDALLRAVKVWTLTPLVSVIIDPEVEAYNIQAQVDRAMASQAEIGWTNLFRGFVSNEWATVYPTPDLLTTDERRERSDKQLKATIRALQDYSLAIWQSRNAVLHEATSASQAIVHASLNHAISQLYSLQSTFSPILQSYFTVPLEVRLCRSPRLRKRWLRLARLATSHSTASGTKQQILSTYFPYASSRCNTNPASFSPATSLPLPPNSIQPSITSFFGLSGD